MNNVVWYKNFDSGDYWLGDEASEKEVPEVYAVIRKIDEDDWEFTVNLTVGDVRSGRRDDLQTAKDDAYRYWYKDDGE